MKFGRLYDLEDLIICVSFGIDQFGDFCPVEPEMAFYLFRTARKTE
jgi:hypothetical protein